jgi:hypothetical protein
MKTSKFLTDYSAKNLEVFIPKRLDRAERDRSKRKANIEH